VEHAPSSSAGSASTNARKLARDHLTSEIKETARRHVAEHGAASLSLRAVARALGLASSALYRYFSSRDELLTALIVDSYDAVGAAAEKADERGRRLGSRPLQRWLDVCRAVRRWAIRHPHEFALIFGSPVPGYRAPQDTVGPAARIPLLLAGSLKQSIDNGSVRPPRELVTTESLVSPDVVAEVGGPYPEGFGDLVERGVVMWTTLIGTIAFELFGHLNQVVTDYAAYFDVAMLIAAQGAGFDLDANR